jgi:hypothetical protein
VTSAIIISRTRKHLLPVVAAAALLLIPSFAFALPIGIVSFDTFIPGSEDEVGVNLFTIGNFTGAFSLAPDFPVVDSLVLADSEFSATRSDGTTFTVNLGDIGPGVVGDPDLLVPESDFFTAATFTATLGSLQFLLADGSTFEAASSVVSVLLLPASGSFLAPGDFALIDIAAAVTAIPEPDTLLLVGIGLAACWRSRHRFSNREVRRQL